MPLLLWQSSSVDEPQIENEPSEPRQRRRARLRQHVTTHGVAIVFGFAIIDLVIRVTISYLTSDPASQGIRSFATSPGMGGVAALCAAIIAFMAVRYQLDHQKTVAREDAWWKSFVWATDRTLPMDGSPTHMPLEWSMALLTPIATEARSDFQKRAAAGVASQVIEMMTTANEAREVEASDPSQLENSPATDVSRSPRSLPESQPPGREAATAPRANVPEGEASRAARQSIERYVAETRDTPARSFIAEQIVDAFKARNVLQNIARRNGLSALHS